MMDLNKAPLRGVIAALLVALLGIGCETTSDAAPRVGLAVDQPAVATGPVTVPLHLADGHLFVPVDINGRSAGWFLLDTGAGVNAVGMGLAGRLNLEPVGRSRARGIAGTENFDLVQIDHWSVGGVPLQPNRAARLNMHRFSRTMDVPAQGILGFAALRHLDFTIDYADATLTLYPPRSTPPPPDAAAEPVPVAIRGGVPLIQALPDGAPPVPVVLDTGANGGLALPQAYLLQHPDIVSVDSLTPSAARGLGGVSRQQASWLRRVHLLGQTLDHAPVRFEAASPGHTPVGRVGHDLLRHIRLLFSHPCTRLFATPLAPRDP